MNRFYTKMNWSQNIYKLNFYLYLFFPQIMVKMYNINSLKICFSFLNTLECDPGRNMEILVKWSV